MQNIDGNMGFVGTESRMYRMSKSKRQLFNAQGSYQKNYWIKEVEVDEKGYTVTLKAELKSDGSSTNQMYANLFFSLPTQKIKGKTITIQYDEWQSNVPGEKFVIGTYYTTSDGTKKYSMLLSNAKSRALQVPISEDAIGVVLRLLVIEQAAISVPAGEYTATFKGIMVSIGKTRRKWEPYKE